METSLFQALLHSCALFPGCGRPTSTNQCEQRSGLYARVSEMGNTFGPLLVVDLFDSHTLGLVRMPGVLRFSD